MRLDVFLKQSRLVKRRTLAKELCDEDAVLVNGRPARAGRELATGDELTLNIGSRRLCVKVEALPERPLPAARARELYRLLSEERIDDDVRA